MSDSNAQDEPSMEEILASIRRIISEDEAAEGEKEAPPAEGDAEPAAEAPAEEPPPAEPEPVQAEPEPEPEPVAEDQGDDFFDLTQEVQDDGSVVDINTGQMIVEADTPEIEEFEDAEPEPPAVGTEPNVDALTTAGLVGPTAAAASTSHFTELAQSVVDQRTAGGIGIGGRTVEDVVKEVMRPMIKEWLDENLADLVERLVQREIDRMSRRAEEKADP